MFPDSATPGPLEAVLAIRQRLGALNAARTKASQTPLRHALCLHYGRVLYGNIGSTDRLDFTIIGEAVNLTARGVEADKAIGSDYLFTRTFVDRFGVANLHIRRPSHAEEYSRAGRDVCARRPGAQRTGVIGFPLANRTRSEHPLYTVELSF